jgi:hypothetical protein
MLDVARPDGVDAFERNFIGDALQPHFDDLTSDARSTLREVRTGEFFDLLPDAPSSAPLTERVLSMGRDFFGIGSNELTEMTSFPRSLDSLSCTQFVTWLLREHGLTNGRTFQTGDELKAWALRQPGWTSVPLEEARVGDVIRCKVPTTRGMELHTVLLSRILDDGTRVYLGANYTDGQFATQVITESTLQGAELLWALRYDDEAASGEHVE